MRRRKAPAGVRPLALLTDLWAGLLTVSAVFLPLPALTGWEVHGLRFRVEDNLELFILLTLLLKVALGPGGGLGEIIAPLGRLEGRVLSSLYRRRTEVLLAAAATVAILSLVEIYLRRFPETLPQPFGNFLASRYHDLHSGIYLRDDPMRLGAMKPNDDRTMYFNGLRWHHHTDGRGFRNPETWTAADVVLLGDSMVYGHGVEEDGTIRHQLAALTGATVVNLGVQGAGTHEEYQILKRYGVALGPGLVLCFFLSNDVDEVADALKDREIKRFLALPVGEHDTDYLESSERPGNWLEPASRLLREPYVVRAWVFLKKFIYSPKGSLQAADLTAVGDDEWLDLPPFRERPRRELAMRFILRAYERMQDLAEREGAAFVVVFIRTGNARWEEVYEQIIEKHCSEQGVDFFSLGPTLEVAIARREAPFLPVDGHLSPTGARIVAEALVERFFGGGKPSGRDAESHSRIYRSGSQGTRRAPTHREWGGFEEKPPAQPATYG